MTKLTLGYWGVRGLGQVARLLAAYVGTELNDVRYTSFQQWTQDKEKLAFQFPNLPYLIDGDFKFTQSAAIYRYIILQSGRSQLLGKNAHDKGRVQNILGVLKDTLKEIKGLFWNKQYATLKNQALQKVKHKLDLLQKFIGQKKFSLGYLTLADFEIAENSYYFATLYPQQYNNWSFWQTIRENFNALPEIEAYYSSQNAFTEPFLPPQRAALVPKFKETVTLGYWAIRGLGHPIRLLLSYTGVNFVDKAYVQRQEYLLKDKIQLNLDFPNLPYLLQGQYKITQSSAIQRYVVNRSNKKELLGKNLQDYIRIEQVLGVFGDIFTEVAKLFFGKDAQALKKQILPKITPKLDNLNKFVGEKDTIFDYLTMADFIVGQYSHYVETAFPEEYKNWPFLGRIRDNINNLPSTKAYYARQGSVKGPFLPPVAGLQPSWEQYK